MKKVEVTLIVTAKFLQALTGSKDNEEIKEILTKALLKKSLIPSGVKEVILVKITDNNE